MVENEVHHPETWICTPTAAKRLHHTGLSALTHAQALAVPACKVAGHIGRRSAAIVDVQVAMLRQLARGRQPHDRGPPLTGPFDFVD